MFNMLPKNLKFRNSKSPTVSQDKNHDFCRENGYSSHLVFFLNDAKVNPGRLCDKEHII